MVFHWSLSDSKSPQVSRTLLGILAVLSIVVWMVSIYPPASKSSSPFDNPLVINRDRYNGVTFMFHHFFKSLAISFISLSFGSILWSTGTTKSTILQVLFFFSFSLIIIRSGILAEIRGSVCMSKSQGSLCVSFSRTDAGLCSHGQI